jgi:hypothetical protein
MPRLVRKNEFGGELGAGSIPGYLTVDQTTSISAGNPFADLCWAESRATGSRTSASKYYNRYKIVEPYFQD